MASTKIYDRPGVYNNELRSYWAQSEIQIWISNDNKVSMLQSSLVAKWSNHYHILNTIHGFW